MIHTGIKPSKVRLSPGIVVSRIRSHHMKDGVDITSSVVSAAEADHTGSCCNCCESSSNLGALEVCMYVCAAARSLGGMQVFSMRKF